MPSRSGVNLTRVTLPGSTMIGPDLEVGHTEPVGHVERGDLDDHRLALLEHDLLLRVLEALHRELDHPLLGRGLGGGAVAPAERKERRGGKRERHTAAPAQERPGARHAAPRFTTGSSSIATFTPRCSSSTSRKPSPR